MYTAEQTEFLLNAMADRKSTKSLGKETPSDDDLQRIFRATLSLADHHQKHPFRFIVLREAEIQQLAQIAGTMAGMSNPSNHKYAKKANLAIAIVFAHHKENATPKWEQFTVAAGAGHLLSMGLWMDNWASHWVSMKDQNNTALKKFHKLRKKEQLLGWIFVGNWAKESEQESTRKRPEVKAHVKRLKLK